jgi:hypothetical protein
VGDSGHHHPAERFKQIQPVLAERGFELTYTECMDDLNAGRLVQFDCLLIPPSTRHSEAVRSLIISAPVSILPP